MVEQTSPKDDAAFLAEWADDIDRNAGGHSVDAARLRRAATALQTLTDKVERLTGLLREKIRDENGCDLAVCVDPSSLNCGCEAELATLTKDGM